MMPKLSPELFLLDIILEYIGTHNDDDLALISKKYKKITERFHLKGELKAEQGDRLIRIAFKQLFDDDYIYSNPDIKKDEAEKNPFRQYALTFKGTIFLSNGGYKRQFQRENKSQLITTVLLWSTGIGGGMTAIYYLLEILRNYILPHSSCLYYTR